MVHISFPVTSHSSKCGFPISLHTLPRPDRFRALPPIPFFARLYPIPPASLPLPPIIPTICFRSFPQFFRQRGVSAVSRSKKLFQERLKLPLMAILSVSQPILDNFWHLEVIETPG